MDPNGDNGDLSDYVQRNDKRMDVAIWRFL